MRAVISSFTDEHYFLSNFYAKPLTVWGIDFPTAEHAFQAGKTTDDWQRRAIATLSTPGRAKQAGRSVTLRPLWNEFHRYEVMEEVLRAKFSDRSLRALLVVTAPAVLIEGNAWGDRTWGVSGGEGHNILGWMLMKLREELL